MEIVKMSDLLKKASIPALGNAIAGQKHMRVVTPYLQKTLNSYSIKKKRTEYPLVLEWNNAEWSVQLGPDIDAKSLYLHAILVHKKGKGTGTEIMNKILDYCDETNTTLNLIPFPIEYSKDPYAIGVKKILPKYLKLKQWYMDFGFKMLADGTMQYLPNSLEQ